MKLAEALIERADLKKRLAQLNNRLCSNVMVNEGSEPVEDPARLLESLNIMTARYEELVRRINLTNAVAKTDNGEELAKMIARRNAKIDQAKAIQGMIDATAKRSLDYYHSACVPKTVIADVRSLRREHDQLSKEVREIDTAIQCANWRTDLL